uniref:Oxidoreductase n=1 Tax=Thermosporothrix sp. COM3 TaxID=2490863 RepID=A0A455SNS3_9CHLR|nr:oxidoreductase [Thermosporothrix sp. COM3]
MQHDSIYPVSPGTETSRPVILRAHDARYNEARRVWNGAFDRYPAEVHLCRSTEQVAWSVCSARQRGLALAVRAGGHSPAGFSALDDGVVIDVRGLQKLAIDPVRRLATVGAGLIWRQFDAAAQEYGLACTGGAFSTVGVAGFTLGGGVGQLLRSCGLGCDNLLSAVVVTADGEIRQASPDADAELYWALRGGAGNFGVVTELTYRLHPVREVTAGMLVYPLTEAVEVIHALRERTAVVPDALTWHIVFATAPLEGGPFPEALRGQPVILIQPAFFGPREEADIWLRLVRSIGRPRVDLVAPITYVALQQGADATAPAGMKWDMRAEWLQAIDDATIATIVAAMEQTTSPLNQVVFQLVGGALARTPLAETPFSFRHATHFIEIISGTFPDDPDFERHQIWGQQLWQQMTRWSAGGGCLNHLGIGEGPERVKAAFRAEAWMRLVALKRRYDPENVFRSTAPISPDGC